MQYWNLQSKIPEQLKLVNWGMTVLNQQHFHKIILKLLKGWWSNRQQVSVVRVRDVDNNAVLSCLHAPKVVLGAGVCL